ncbi:MAG: FAD-binding oxidoreductase [Chloroflexota bacterium]
MIVQPKTVEEIVAVMKDSESYPSPVRAVGSNHSTTHCGVSEGGTVVDLTAMDGILEIGTDYVTAQAGALYIDVAKKLEKHGLQFFVNVELGNLTIGSACCGGTKDASMPGEFGQVCSYAISIKLVTPSGELMEVTEEDPELLQVMRSSYGLLGIVYEATFRVQPLQAMAVRHETYSLEQFERQLPELINRDESMMLYLYPFLDAVTVEYRRYVPPSGSPNRMAWRLRNYVWKDLAPTIGYYATHYVPFEPLRYLIINGFNRVIQFALKLIVNSKHTLPADQIIRYPHTSGRSKYTFSIWAFPEEEYVEVLRKYFAFCKDYYGSRGYRCDLLNVGYRILKDTSSLFSYSYDGNVMTVDPVSTGSAGWDDFLRAYNAFCSENGGIPLFNQTKWIEPEQARKAFGDRIEKFGGYRRQYDPDGRLLNSYFAERLA